MTETASTAERSCAQCGTRASGDEEASCSSCGAALPPVGQPQPQQVAESAPVPDSSPPPPTPPPPPGDPGQGYGPPAGAPPWPGAPGTGTGVPGVAVQGPVACPGCGQAQGGQSQICQLCGQAMWLPGGFRLSSAGKRLGQYLLDALLALVTLYIGYLVWSIIIWGRGQTPAMQLLHMRAVKTGNGATASRGTMALRELVGKWLLMDLIWLIFFPAALVLYFMLLWDGKRQQLWDKIADTVVVEGDPVLATPATATDFGTARAEGS